jgi:hypothetical protein
VPVGTAEPERVVVGRRVVVGMRMGLEVMDALGGREVDAGMKIMDDVAVMVELW